MRDPVYVLFTKADLIAGFVEFFDDLGREEREQVWGMTFAARRWRTKAAQSGLRGEFDALLGPAQRPDDGADAAGDRTCSGARLIFGFPQQVA